MVEALCLVVFFLCLGSVRLPACGPGFPNNLLDAGDHAVLQPPIADFQRELERMKLVAAKTRAVPLAEGQRYSNQSTEVEMSDLAAALKRAKVSSGQATVIMQTHLAERMKLNAYLALKDEWEDFDSWVSDTNGYHPQANTNPPPVFPAVAVTPGLPREFADYFEGAIEWHNHGGWSAAEPWERLLQLPAAERHFKSTWAAFMLARYYWNSTNGSTDDEAIKRFEEVRSMARNGFADSAGLATASIGCEAQIYLGRKNYERAIELYLEQFAAGDDSAVNSLRFTAARAVAETNSTAADLETLARSPRARRVITAYLISRNPYNDPREADTDPQAKRFFDGTTAWLEAVEAVDAKDVESAGQLALAAYQAGQMDIAQRWINRAKNEPVTQWLQAKLFMRAGKIPDAAKLLAKLSRGFPQDYSRMNGPAKFADSLFVNINEDDPDLIAIGRQTFGELGVLRLVRREYVEALDALLRSGYWMDAAYVAERVLSADELKTYVGRDWPAVTPAKAAKETVEKSDGDWDWQPKNIRQGIRSLLARRLARLNRYDEARVYYPSDLLPGFDALVLALRKGRDGSLSSSAQRAEALSAAAFITRTNGMELLGTELDPDWYVYGGDYQGGVSQDTRTNENARLVAPSDDELQRAAQHGVEPEERFHYRFQAAALCFEAASLMPDNSNETARLLCTAGSWIKYLDPKKADPIYKALVRRCRKTEIGSQADAMRWFPVLDAMGNPLPCAPRSALPLLKPKFDSIRMFDRERGWAQNANDAILTTTNGGQSWTTVLSGSTNEYLNACFYDADTAWVVAVYDEGTNVAVMQTRDGGHSWSHSEMSQASLIQWAWLSFSDPDTGWLMLIPDHGMSSSPGYLYRTQDGGASWHPINSTEGNYYEGDDYTKAEFARPHTYLSCGGRVVWRNPTNGWLLGSMESTTPAFLFITGDGGATWQLQTLPPPASLHDGRMQPDSLPQFFPSDGQTGVIGATFIPTDPDSTNLYKVICVTHDGGLTWQATTPVEYGGAWNFLTDQKGWMWSQKPSFINVTTPVQGILYRTDNGGITWSQLPTAKGLATSLTHRDDIVQLDFVDQDCGWAMSQEWNDLPTRLLQSTDGGRTWIALPRKENP